MKKSLLASVLIVLAAGLGFSDQGLVLRGAYGEFSCLGIQNGRVFIFTGKQFHIFELKDGTPIKTFGRVGQGPGEYGEYFAFPLFSPENVVVNNQGQCIVFSHDGTYLRSLRPDGFSIKTLPLDSGYISQIQNVDPKTMERTRVVSILDEALKPVREIYRQKDESLASANKGIIRTTYPSPLIDFAYDRGIIYVGDPAEAISFSLYDKQGQPIRTIRRECSKIRVSENDRKTYLQTAFNLTLAPGKTLKSEVEVETYYPAFRFFKVDQGLIYVFTYRVEGGKREVIVLDGKGNDVAAVGLPAVPAVDSCILDKKFYYVVYDESLDELVLHAEDIFPKAGRFGGN